MDCFLDFVTIGWRFSRPPHICIRQTTRATPYCAKYPWNCCKSDFIAKKMSNLDVNFQILLWGGGNIIMNQNHVANIHSHRKQSTLRYIQYLVWAPRPDPTEIPAFQKKKIPSFIEYLFGLMPKDDILQDGKKMCEWWWRGISIDYLQNDFLFTRRKIITKLQYLHIKFMLSSLHFF